MTKLGTRRKAQLVTAAAWLILTPAWGWWYVRCQLALPGLVGYEKSWEMQVWFFVLTRLPVSVVALALLLWLEHRVVRAATGVATRW